MLLESIIAISLITVIMSARGVFFMNTVASAGHQRTRATGIQVADSIVENLRSHDSSSLVSGRDASSVTTQFASSQATAAPIQAALTSMDQAVDANASTGAGSSAFVPTTGKPQTQGTVTYTVNQYLGWCYIPTSGSSTNCVKSSQIANGASKITYLRA
ncbi:MAG: hypothetical protein JWO57_3852, partial [Pseudonocardiales bacterium]|nr:hypothetical protein [Pseudonocardiales bacterium]